MQDLAEIEKEHEGVDAKIASGGGRMRVTMDRYEVGAGHISRSSSCSADSGPTVWNLRGTCVCSSSLVGLWLEAHLVLTGSRV